MGVIGIDHVQLAIPAGGEAEARTFFVGVLGFDEVPKPAGLSREGAWFQAPGVSLHVGSDPDFRPARKAHPALLVSDLSQTRRDLAAHGFEFHEDTPVEGYERGFTYDPFGNKVELMQRLS